jgi:type IV pilus assembly protein PilE
MKTCAPHHRHKRQSGFTLIELMIAVVLVSILTSLALPAYSAFVTRARVPTGLVALTTYYARMEQRFQDTGNYGVDSACALPGDKPANFTLSCAVTSSGRGFVATASGSGPLAGYVYTIDQFGNRSTLSHPRGAVAGCWTVRGGTCDS